MYNVLDYLENSCNKFSNKIAVIEEDKELTYKELVNYSKSVGSFLSKKGALNEPIIIFMDKGIDTLISFFGSVYASCYYTLLNPTFPYERISQIKDVLNSRFVFTNKEYLNLAEEYFKDLEVYDILINDNLSLAKVKGNYRSYYNVSVEFKQFSQKGILCH